MNKFKKLPLSNQVLLFFGTLCLLFLAIGTLHFFSLQVIQRRARKEALELKLSASINDSAQDLEHMQSGVLRQLLANDSAEINRLDLYVRDIQKTNAGDLRSYVSFADSEKERQLYQRVMQSRKIYWDHTQQVLSFGLMNRDSEATQLIIAKQSPAYDAYLTSINDLHDYIETAADEMTEGTNRFISGTRIIGNVLGGIAISIVLGSGFAVARIARRLKEKNRILQNEVAERKRVEQQLMENTQRMLLQTCALEVAANGVVITDHRGNIQWVNAAFTQLTGYSATEVLGRNPRILKSSKHPESFYKNLWSTISTGKVWRGELSNRRKNGQLYHEEMTITPVIDAGGAISHFIAVKQDISQRKEAELEMLKLSCLVQNSNDFVGIASMEGQAEFINAGGRKLVGLSEEQKVETIALTDCIHEVDREMVQNKVLPTMFSEGSWKGEVTFKHLKTGAPITMWLEGFFITDVLSGQRIGLATIAHDITRRKQDQAQVRLQSSALTAAANAIVITDFQGRINWVNPAFTKLTGYSAEEAVGNFPRILKSGHHSDAFYRGMWSTIRGGRIRNGELINRQKNGGLYYEEMTITPVIDPNGAITHFIAIKQDITGRKRTEEELQQKTALFEAQVESALDGILVVDNQGKHLIKNERFLKLWKIPQHIAVDPEDRKSLEYVMGQNKNPAQFLEKIDFLNSRPNEVSRDEIELIDGRVFDRYSSPVRIKNGKHFGRVWTFRDITELKKAEVSMQEMHEKLVTASREAGKSEVAVSVLHNVGNVLNSVCVSCLCVANELKKSKSNHLSKVVTLLDQHAADLCAFLTRDAKGKQIPGYLAELAEHLALEQSSVLEELGRLQSNLEHIKEIVAVQQCYATVSGVSQTVQIGNLIEEALRMAFSSPKQQGVKISRELASDLPEVNLDKHKALQILVNLIGNAIEACDVPGLAEKRLTIRVVTAGSSLRVTIADNGIGISEENITRVFNHGFTTKKNGHGFGLHNSALAANEMGGSLTAQSDGPGRGSTFILELPLKRHSTLK
jgi:PAS domain S-box-containing protein